MFQKQEKKQVLLVDNFDQVREVTKSILEGAGYAVAAASNIGDALKLLSKKKPDFIISEIELPGIGGIGLYNRLKKEDFTAPIPFIFFTNYDAKNIQPRLQKYEDIILSKSTAWKEVLIQVEAFLRMRQSAKKKKKISKPAAEKKDSSPKAVPQEAPAANKKTAILEKAPASKKTAILQAPEAKKTTSEKTSVSKKTQAISPVSEKAKKLEAQPAPKKIQIAEMTSESHEEDKKAESPKKHLNTRNTLPPGHSTRHFSVPSSIFDGNNMGNLASTLFTQCKRGRPGKEDTLQFAPLEIPTEGLKEKLKQTRMAQARGEEELLEDLEWNEAEADTHSSEKPSQYLIEDEDILVEMDETFVEEVFKESTKEDTGAWEGLAPSSLDGEKIETEETVAAVGNDVPASQENISDMQEKATVDPLAEPRKLLAQSFPQYSFAGSLECQSVPRDFEETAGDAEMCHDFISFSGLCLQMFNQDFAVQGLVVETEEKDIFLLPKDEQSMLFAVVPKKQ